MKVFEFKPAGLEIEDSMITYYEVELRHWQGGVVAKWWHRPVVWVHRRLWSRFVLCIPDGEGGGDVYYEGFLTASVVRHEACHCVQAAGRMIRFALGFMLIPGQRLEDESEAYAESLAYLSHAKTFAELHLAVGLLSVYKVVRSKRVAYLWPVVWMHRVEAGVAKFYKREYSKKGYRVTYLKR